MIELTYRPATIDDLEQIQTIHEEAASTSASHYSQKEVELMTKYNQSRMKKNLLDTKRTTIIVEHKNIPIAYAMYTLEKKWVNSLFVNPKYSRKGVGTFIVNIIISIFKENAITKIGLHARKSSIDFYKKFGFKEVEDFDWIIDEVPVKLKTMELEL